MVFGTIMVAFGTTNIGLCAKVGQKQNVIAGTSENPVRQIEFKNLFKERIRSFDGIWHNQN